VIRRGRALVGSGTGTRHGERRVSGMDIETTIEVVIAPVLMLLIWRFSMASCHGQSIDPAQYLAIHGDLLRQGLACGVRYNHAFVGTTILAQC
jgi:hypothetical protein